MLLVTGALFIKRHRYMNYENETGVYARPESRDQFRKQPPEVFCKKKSSKKIHKFHCKAPVLEPLFKKFSSLQA